MILEPGHKLVSQTSGRTIVVEELVGAGGQGEIYRAGRDTGDVALKWILPTWAAGDYFRALESLVSSSAPDDRFLWPSELVTDSSVPGFGYVMPYRESRFKTIGSVVAGEVCPPTSVRARAGHEIVAAFRSLHARGLCYRDVSDDNIALDIATGEIRISDNDNIAVDGLGLVAIGGTPGFTAPEVVRGEARPSADTDMWSIPVLLFHLLLNAHPLEGAREAAIHCKDADAIMALYGYPLFIFDPADDSNRPVPGLHDGAIRLWPMYTERLRALFTRAFTEGLTPGRRVRGTEWRSALIELEDSVQRCSCGAENVYDEGRSSARYPCWRCHKRLPDPLLLRIDDASVVANIGKRLYPHHTSAPRNSGDFSSPTAEIVRVDGGGVALMNCSTSDWSARADGQRAAVRPGQRVGLQSGLSVVFGSRTARVA